jgi:GDP-4-dehydro-6-deoxy-D-mannose reductase
LLDELVTLSTAQVRVTVDPSRLRPSDMSTLVGDFGRLRADTGWAPTIPFSQTMHDLLAYWRTTIAAS